MLVIFISKKRMFVREEVEEYELDENGEVTRSYKEEKEYRIKAYRRYDFSKFVNGGTKNQALKDEGTNNKGVASKITYIRQRNQENEKEVKELAHSMMESSQWNTQARLPPPQQNKHQQSAFGTILLIIVMACIAIWLVCSQWISPRTSTYPTRSSSTANDSSL